MNEKSDRLSGRQAAGYIRLIFGLPEPEEIEALNSKAAAESPSVIRGSLTTESYEAAEAIQISDLTRQIEQQVANLAAESQTVKPGKKMKF